MSNVMLCLSSEKVAVENTIDHDQLINKSTG